jgi:hypothetical protein
MVTAHGHGAWSRRMVTAHGHGAWSRRMVTVNKHECPRSHGRIRTDSRRPRGRIRTDSRHPRGRIRTDSRHPRGRIRTDSRRPRGRIRTDSRRPRGRIRTRAVAPPTCGSAAPPAVRTRGGGLDTGVGMPHVPCRHPSPSLRACLGACLNTCRAYTRRASLRCVRGDTDAQHSTSGVLCRCAL